MSSQYRLEGSKDAISSDLDLFLTPPTASGVEQVEWVDYRPVNSVGLNGSVEFRIPASGMQYIDMRRTMLYWKGQAVDENGADATLTNIATEKVVPVNNILHSVFSQVDVTLNQKLISSHTQHYAYKSMIESFLNYDKSAQESQMYAAGFEAPSPSVSRDPTLPKLITRTEGSGSDAFKFKEPNPLYNEALVKRYVSYRANADFIGIPFADLFQQDRLLLNGVEVGVKMYRHQPDFYMTTGKASDIKKYQIKFTDILLRVCKVRLSPQLLLSHEKMLETTTAKYPYMRTELKTINVPINTTTYRADNLYQGKVPSKLVVTGVSSFSSAGSISRDPFNFTINGVSVDVKVDGVSVPMQVPLSESSVTAYYSSFQGLQRENSDFGTVRTRGGSSKTFMCFDLTGVANSLETYPLFKRGEVSIEFTLPASHTFTMMALAYFPDMYQVDKSRNILI